MAPRTRPVSKDVQFALDRRLWLPKDQWKKWKLRLTPWTVAEILYFRRVKQNSPEWAEARKNFVGSSGLAELVGLNEYNANLIIVGICSILGIYNPIYRDPSYSEPNFKHGHTYEDVGAYIFSVEYKFVLEEVGIIVNNKWPFFGASCDRLIKPAYMTQPMKERAVAEFKSNVHQVMEEVPPQYHSQVHLQMAAMEYGMAYFVSFYIPKTPGDGAMNVIRVPFNEEYWEDFLLPRFYEVAQLLQRQDVDTNPQWAKIHDWPNQITFQDRLIPLSEERLRYSCAKTGVELPAGWALPDDGYD